MSTSGLRAYDGAIAIITGGASGIGRALGLGLASRGATVVLADVDHEDAVQVAADIVAAGGKASASHLDVRDAGAFEALANQTFEAHGRVDYLFNNAGIGVGGVVDDYAVDSWNRVFDVNIRGVTNGVQAVYRPMRKQGFGHIINTASIAGLLPFPLATSYCTSKHAIVGLSSALRIEAADAGVRVSALCPGFIRTPILVNGGKHGGTHLAASVETQLSLMERGKPMDAEPFAKAVLAQIPRNPAFIIVPWWWKLVWLGARLSPSLMLFMATKGYNDAVQVLGADESAAPSPPPADPD